MRMNEAPAYQVEDNTTTLNRVAVSIGNTAHVMRILAQSTYSDPIGAVVRETIANAMDAHSNIKSTAPFRITVPGLLDPNFKCRDFGCGMSEEFFLTRYAVAGDTTKGETNEEIGGFGMGRFSAFAYSGCDQYYVKAFKSGKWFLGSVTRDADFNLFVQVENRGSTTEPDGVEIIVPVKAADFRKFEEAVTTFTEFLDPQPDGVAPLEPKRVLLAGGGWRITAIEHSYNATYKKLAIMGGIPYKLGPEKVFCKSREEGVQNPLSSVYGFEFDFPIGALSVAASREELRYDEKTIKAVQEAFAVAFAEIEVQATGIDSKYATDWERWNSSEVRVIRKVLGQDTHEKLRKGDFDPTIFHDFKRVREYSGRSSICIKSAALGPEVKFHFFLADCQKWRAPYRRAINEIAADGSSGYTIVVKDEAQFAKIGNPPFTRISTLPTPPKEKREKRSTPAYVAPREMYRRDNRDWHRSPDTLDLSTPKIYFPFNISLPDENFNRLFELYDFPGRNDVTGLPKVSIKDAEAAGWKSFVDDFKSRITDEQLDAYSIWGNSALMNKRGVIAATTLAMAGFKPTFPVFSRLKKVGSVPDNHLQFLAAIGCPCRQGPAYEFDKHWALFQTKHPVLFKLLSHKHFSIGDGYWDWKIADALELARKAL